MGKSTLNHAAEPMALTGKHDFFIGIDSDGCAFDSMEIKHKECFCPAFIKHFELQPASKCAREVWEFVNLYSRDRGCNRFFAIQKALRLLAEREEVAARGLKVNNLPALDAWLKAETKLGNPALETRVRVTNDEGLAKALAWSQEVNQRVEDLVRNVPPFPMLRESLAKVRADADVMVVSQTPREALEREWQEHGIDELVDCIAGQEAGTKTEQIRFGANGRYAPQNVLMIGDAFGDLKAARDNNALFFPIVPGNEDRSWQRFFQEGSGRFFNGTFAGEFQEALLQEFVAALPEKAPWQT